VTRSRRAPRGTRERLNQGQVVDAAVALADRRGIEALDLYSETKNVFVDLS